MVEEPRTLRQRSGEQADSKTAVGRLPELIRRYLAQAVPAEGTAPRQVRIAQTGQMWQKPGGRSLRLTAEEHFAVERVAFAWRARFPLLGPFALDVVDRFADGEGELRARLLGVPVMRQAGAETALGEAVRYLAELPWVPYAIANNRELAWRELGRDTVEVSTVVESERPTVQLDFDDAGDIVRASSMRPLKREGVWQPMPWAGEFESYETLGGIRMPTRAEVYWQLPEGRHVYWRGQVTSAVKLQHPFASGAR